MVLKRYTFDQAPDSELQDGVIYARYSSYAQRDVSIEEQVADCMEFARRNNIRIVKVYADRHLTGRSDKRPEFQQMMKDAAHGGWAYVVTWKTDRFARNRYDSATYKYHLKKHGVRVLYAKENIPDAPEGILLESILEGSAEYYSANLAQNTMRGMLYNAGECKVNGGTRPYGYRRGEDGRYVIDEAEAEVVREIFRKAAQGVPFVEIANALNARGVKTIRGNRWGKNSFQRMIRNQVYIGVYRWGEKSVPGGMPAIVDEDTFWKVDKLLTTKPHPRGRQGENAEYMLTGKLFCGLCGSYMVGFSGTGKVGGKHYYYGCQKRKYDRECTKEHVSRDWIERVVVQATLDYVLRDDVIEWIADAVMAYQDREAATAELQLLETRLSENEKATANLLKAIEAGVVTATTKRRMLELEAEAADLEREIRAEKAMHTHLDRDQVIFWMEKFKGGSLDSVEFRRRVIDSFVSAVYVTDDHLRIVFNYSGEKNDVDMALVMDAEATAGPEDVYSPGAGGSHNAPAGSPKIKRPVWGVLFFGYEQRDPNSAATPRRRVPY